MVEKNVIFIISTIFLIYFSTRVNSQCVQTSPCSCVLSDGSGYDFSSLTKQGPLNTSSSNPTGEIQFWFQPCKDVKLSDISNVTDNCSKVSLCIQNNSTASKIKFPQNGGTVSESKLELLNGKNLILVYKHNDYTTKINLVCCSDCSSYLHIDSLPSVSEARLILVSPSVCKYQKEGISSGSVFFILLLVFAGVYFIGGALALKFLRGATGWEMLPNHKFWCALGNQIKIGFLFLCSGCKENSYERI